ncbi:putative bifunctional diguanylate cyclase/phosphodiesterase [Rubellimicrobium aerolatum]|uniref:Bifunctional diguanylate cyclase/phosphodiesterase n=1 Tax=Rubellimicrobium aerolatum TaxID=490979 RepID=A0ABW0SAB9_9RHOB|nr:bifunctional diguanylate cyclase/phosphodiesterase [Rubellimicrobium aerolatum]MBP1805229.1 diguanylate cyclase (GGDEF)-like protein [Rubellimicrobium aerolatum]
MHRLPSLIASVTGVAMLIFATTTVASILWMAQALDRQALTQSETQARVARDHLLSQARVITIDYAKWDAAHRAILDGDAAWLFDNIGSSALMGEAVQLAAIWGGPSDIDIGWETGGDKSGQPGILPPATRAAVDRQLAGARPGTFGGTEFFAWRNGGLFVLGASHFEPVENAPLFPEAKRQVGQLVMGIRIDRGLVAGIADAIALTGLEVVRRPAPDRPSVTLPGVDGTPVGHITWDVPRPGTAMLDRLLVPLSLVAVATALLAILAMRLLRRSASDLVAAEQRASTAARRDPLTGLPNRAAFQEALALPARTGERAILFLDLNGFKGVNDSLGHAAGDAVIVSLARRIALLLGPGALLARISGDEFVLMVTGPEARERIAALAEAIARSFDDPFEVLGHQLRVSAAIGYAVQDGDAMRGADLVRQADLAMYEGKRLGGRAPVAFGALIEEGVRNALVLERALRTALAARPEEFSVAYQPILGIDGRFRRAEALARWTSAEHGEVPPDRFIALAEKAGLVIDLGRIILGRVRDDLAADAGLRVSVNISSLQLLAPDFIADLVADLRARSIDPARIQVELTESVLVRDPAQAARHLHELRAAGFGVALDDFGTGYSSVAYLDQLSFDTLKIDRSFVSEVRHSPKRHALLRTMIQMAHGLDLEVVCEGVESEDDLRLLAELGCDLVQGFHLGRPMPVSELSALRLTASDRAAA